MTTQLDEQLSSFMDGEMDEHERQYFMEKLCQDKSMKQRWSNYHIISDALRNNLPPAVDRNFSQAVMNRLADEPTVLSPHKRTKPSTLSKRVAGVAIAASVAAVAVLGVQSTHNSTSEPQLAQMPTSDQYVRMAQPQVSSNPSANIASIPVQSSLMPAMKASATQSNGPAVVSKLRQEMNPNARYNPHFHKYILDHNQNVSGTRLQGVMPFARIVVSPSSSQQGSNQQ